MDTVERSTWYKVRKFFTDLHLWMGLASGLIVIVVCFSGTVYVFNTELRERASPELYELDNVSPDQKLPIGQIISRVEKQTGGKVQSVRIPADPSRTWQVSVKEISPDHQAATAPGGKPGAGTTQAVNPYTGDVIGNISNTRNGVTELMRTMFSLHRWLLLDRIEEPIFGELPNRKLGSYITGTATILFTLGVLTGLIIWFPQKLKNWKQGLRIKWNASWKRINHDLHNSLAFYSLIFLFLMGVTGPQWSFPWYRESLQKTLGTFRPPDAPKVEPVKSKQPGNPGSVDRLSVEAYLEISDKALPYKGDYLITLPSDSTSAVFIAKNRTGFFAPAAGDKLALDQYTGNILEKDIFRDKAFNERIAGSIKALHMGDVYGTFTKIIYFFACLVATTLPITGTTIWINKLLKRRKKALKAKRTSMTSSKEVVGAKRISHG